MTVRYSVLALCVLAVSLSAQSDRGTIAGTVTDRAGAIIPGARVTATHSATNVQYKATTAEAGDFNLPSLPVGAYRVIIEQTGFKAAVHPRVQLESGTTARIDTTLEIGGVHQSIEVSAQSTQLQTDNAKIQNQISNRMIESLPTVVGGNMRSPFDLAGITAQVSGGDQDFQIGGGQQGTLGVMLDGASANTNRAGSTLWAAVNAPSLDAITEFTVETNGYKAEFGRAGGGMITFVSKSGTNEYHGTAFDFIRNNAFDARGFFNASVPVYRQHDFGATIGGPVRIPKLYNGKNRTFFFFSFEAFRNRVGGSTKFTFLPPVEFYKGDFRNAVSRTLNPDGLIANLLRYNQIAINTLPASLNIFTAAGRNLLNTTFNNSNQLVQRAGFTKPYSNFLDALSLERSLRPYPQYDQINTGNSGDHSGHSSYHSMVFKVTRRYASNMEWMPPTSLPKCSLIPIRPGAGARHWTNTIVVLKNVFPETTHTRYQGQLCI